MIAYPYMAYRFVIIIDGIIEAGFTDVSGLDVTTQVEEYREGGENNYVHKLPKETTFGNITLKKGIADTSHLWDWHMYIVSGIIRRKNISIQLLNDQSNPDGPYKVWNFQGAYPVKWVGPEFKADSNAVAFQSIELVHRGYTLASFKDLYKID
jgi:phage tail-like protein